MATTYLPLKFAPFRSVLVANRGEIGVRVIRACRDLGLSPLAIYSDADVHSRHVSLADAAACVGAGPSADSYLKVENILRAAKELGAEAVHPGFGFLSENADFAQAVLQAGMVWIGPSPQSIADMGDKTVAKRRVTAAGVPCSPGKNEPLKDVDDLRSVVKTIGYPLILKAAAGGGGRGMRVVRSDAELATSFEACQREAQSYFGNPEVFCERYIERPRHVEIQILADGKGNTLHLFERDCTIQRRHQKLIEEAPSSYLSEKTRLEMGQVAVKAAQSVGYVNAGTVEFILESPTQFYFMEMNTRIQVEHPVTEMVTGFDLVQWQLRVARGESLPVTQDSVKLRGHAMEARINAEDAYNGFRPNPGLISHVEFPAGPGVRVDSHIYSGYRIPEFYDSMIAKLIVHGETRDDCMNKMRRALGEFRLDGVETSIPYAQALMDDEKFRAGDYTTRFVEDNEDLLARAEAARGPVTEAESVVAALRVGLSQGAAGTRGAPGGQGAQEENAPQGTQGSQGSRGSQSVWSHAARLEATRRIGG